MEYIDNFSGMHKKATFRSKICGHEWEAIPNNIIYGQSGCPYCYMSHGETRIFNYLTSENIDFEMQKSYDDLLGVNFGKLSYDFYLMKHNILIEFQGQQHENL